MVLAMDISWFMLYLVKKSAHLLVMWGLFEVDFNVVQFSCVSG
jgi:hypothetical protein